MAANLRALHRLEPHTEKLARFETVSKLLTGNLHATSDDGIHWLSDLCRDLSIPSLRKFGIEPKDFPAICEKAAIASSMKGNPVELKQVELAEILEQAL